MHYKTEVKSVVFLIALTLQAGCTSIDPKPFEQFNLSLTELNKGATSTLDVTIPLAEARYRQEVESEATKGDDTQLQQLQIGADAGNPFFISNPPAFVYAKRFKTGISQANLAWMEYSSLLLQLASKELTSDEKFSKLSEDLNKNAFSAAQSLSKTPSDISAENMALFSTLAAAAAKEYIRTEQKEKLRESLADNQDSISAYSKHMQDATIIMAISSTHEHSEKQQNLTRDFYKLVNSNKSGNNDAKIQKNIADMIDTKTSHLNQMESLQALYLAYGKIPAAHETLITQLDNSDSSIAAINDLLERTTQLHASYDAKAKANKAELIQAKADAANSEATAAEITYQQVKLRYTQAHFEYTVAQNDSNSDPGNTTKAKDAETKKKIAENLKIEVEKLKTSSETLRAAAAAMQESANEVKSSIINN